MSHFALHFTAEMRKKKVNKFVATCESPFPPFPTRMTRLLYHTTPPTPPLAYCTIPHFPSAKLPLLCGGRRGKEGIIHKGIRGKWSETRSVTQVASRKSLHWTWDLRQMKSIFEGFLFSLFKSSFFGNFEAPEPPISFTTESNGVLKSPSRVFWSNISWSARFCSEGGFGLRCSPFVLETAAVAMAHSANANRTLIWRKSHDHIDANFILAVEIYSSPDFQ